jgi:hypothetical protein
MNSPKVFTIAELNTRLEQVASVNRHDQVSRMMHEIFENRASKNPNQLVTSSEFAGIFSKVANMNKQSDFRFHFSDIFEGSVPAETPSKTQDAVGATSRLAGFEEDFRPSPIEVTNTDEDIIKNASLKAISSVLDGVVDNAQYHFNEFVQVEGYGKNSGFASWTVAFNTGKGTAKISVPTPIIDGVTETPSVFYASAGKAIRFDKENIKKFAQSYVHSVKQATNGSGIETLGGTSIITDRQNLSEGSQMAIDVANAFGGGVMVSEDSGAVISSAFDKKKMVTAIEIARKFVESKIGSGIELEYTAGMETDDKKHIIAFNVSRNTAEGLKIATIPVEVDGVRCAAETFYDSSQEAHSLEPQRLNSYLSAPVAEMSAPEVDSFTDAFLTTNSTFQQLQKELKYAAYENKSDRAKSVLHAIANRFGEESLTSAMDDFKTWTVEAIEVKAGKREKPKEIVEKESSFDGVLKSSSIVFN